ncbi:TetR/AcrR family transcriptional regulator [Salipaludibacillus aurantiacus]|uniref:DNA-binding transcriptional regulator, AcrR family n=1 Tax=Salipaludibacillus aurantiacus TaxID=1601833 RepID=A0A1H9VM80_9BACI|nr:TetR/AcrR family transcriptional regulator [Salipaludibacillus aurantiacus]SES22303.1 DNA-binding transcriptional regulator, AcrR family [Salipaludibacillus aurantiacus]
MKVDKRKQIFEASLELFSERGYDATTLPMIAEAADVGAGTVYRYFKNKEALLNELFQEYIGKLKDTILRNYLENEEDLTIKFDHLFAGMVQFADKNIKALYFIDSHSHSHALNEKSNAMYHSLLDIYHEFIAEGQKKKLIKPLPSYALIVMVFGAFIGCCKYIQRGHIKETETLMDHFKECCWDAINL